MNSHDRTARWANLRIANEVDQLSNHFACPDSQHERQDESRTIDALERIAEALERLAPTQNNVVDARFVADLLGCTTEWVARQARDGRIPSSCVVQGTGNGKPWKFHLTKINGWIESR